VFCVKVPSNAFGSEEKGGKRGGGGKGGFGGGCPLFLKEEGEGGTEKGERVQREITGPFLDAELQFARGGKEKEKGGDNGKKKSPLFYFERKKGEKKVKKKKKKLQLSRKKKKKRGEWGEKRHSLLYHFCRVRKKEKKKGKKKEKRGEKRCAALLFKFEFTREGRGRERKKLPEKRKGLSPLSFWSKGEKKRRRKTIKKKGGGGKDDSVSVSFFRLE